MGGQVVGLGLGGRGCHSGVRHACPLPPTCPGKLVTWRNREGRQASSRRGHPVGGTEGKRQPSPA